MVQTKRDIQSLLATAGIRPLKRFGQNFLIDGNLMRKLLVAAEPGPTDVVLEVGPGTGSLTEELLAISGHVVAVEIDRTLQTVCWDRFGASPRFTLIRGDVLERKTSIALQVRRTLLDRHLALGGRLMLVANLPYQVATPLVVDLLLSELPVSLMCFTVQAEVADRLMAEPGTKEYGPISVFCQLFADVSRIARVPASAFWPAPKVESAMVKIHIKSDVSIEPDVQSRITELVHGCFNHRRKTMHWNLRAILDESAIKRVVADGRWDLTLRPENVTVAQWLELARFLS